MAMQNFWVNASGTGRKTDLGFGVGSTSKDGELSLSVRMIDNGSSVEACDIQCSVMKDGKLRVRVNGAGAGLVFEKITTR